MDILFDSSQVVEKVFCKAFGRFSSSLFAVRALNSFDYLVDRLKPARRKHSISSLNAPELTSRKQLDRLAKSQTFGACRSVHPQAGKSRSSRELRGSSLVVIQAMVWAAALDAAAVLAFPSA